MFRKENLYLLLFLVSVVGLLIVQYQYLRVGLVLADSQFSSKIDKVKERVQDDLSEYNSLSYSLSRSVNQNTALLQIDFDSLQRMNAFYLKDYLQFQLKSEGITTDFSFELKSRDSITYLTSEKQFEDKEESVSQLIPIKGYLQGSTEKELLLVLYFQDINNYFLSQLQGLIIPGLVFILLIVFVVIWVLRSYYGQSHLISTTNNFINNLTHELKTPVFSIKLATKILEERLPDKEQPVLKLIKRESDRLLVHIHKVLDLASLESGKKIINLTETDLRPVLEAIVEDYKLLEGQGLLTFNEQLADGAYVIKGEISHLESALLNILDNARKYATDPVISLKTEIIGTQLKISIRDNGIGMSQKELNSIFKKYYRVIKDDSQPVSGYGLGLAYVNHIMRLHKVKMQVESEPGRGTQFSLYFKLIKPANDE